MTMKSPIRLLLAAALVALPLASRAEECCAAKKAGECAAGPAGAACCAAGAQSVRLKFKSPNAEAIKTALARVEGVTGVDTCPESKFTTISFSRSRSDSDKILTAVKKAGLRVEARRVTFAVDGMACGACSDKVAAALSKVKGVSANQVCHETKTATVDFNPGKVSTGKVLAAIEAAGFKATESLN